VIDDHAVWSARLDEYLDGSGDRAEIAAVEAHLETCAACRDELRAIEGLREGARGLRREIAPSRDLWAGIAARIEEANAPAAPPAIDIAERRRRPRIPWAWLAAAAVILVVVSSGATALLLRGGGGATTAPLASSSANGAARPVGLAAFASAEVEYESAVSSLEAELAARRDRLQPETIAAVEQNLAIIDAAIAEARAALAADPSSADLPLLLSGVYLQKVELLRTALDLTART
jgi:anti-sigma factor RsiW